MSTGTITDFLGEIISVEYPQQLGIFHSYKSLVTERMAAGSDMDDLVADSNAENEFMNVEGPAVSSLALLTGTVKTVIEMTAPGSKKSRTAENVRENWKKKLVEQGIDENEAEGLVQKYIEQLLSKL